MNVKQRLTVAIVKQLHGFISDKRIEDLIQTILFIVGEDINLIVCKNCGTVDDYYTRRNGPHIEAKCKSCDKHIKFLKQTKQNHAGSGYPENKMADKIIHGRIDVTKINKDWLYKGEKGTYLDFTMFYNEEQDEYGQNGMVVQSVPSALYKKEKEAGVTKDKMSKGNILGNLKEWSESNNRKESTPGYRGEEEPKKGDEAQEVEEDLPF